MGAEVGKLLSHYRILAKLGAGGMGVVYKAQDEKLHRPVALKVLRPDALGDEERRQRFLREASSAAAVAHPYIAAVYEADEADGVIFIAMEYVDGQTLRSLLRNGALRVRDALRVGTEIAEGLARAHEAHVVHRDLKPENVMVRPDGHVKILDFGLAKLVERRDEAVESTTSGQGRLGPASTRCGSTRAGIRSATTRGSMRCWRSTALERPSERRVRE